MSSRSSASTRSSLLVLLALLLVSQSAWARRIAVTKFTGKGDSAQKVVQELIGKDNTVVSDAAVKRAQKKLHVASLTETTVPRVATELQVDAIVQGSVQRTGAKWGLTLTILDGRTGAVSDTLSIPLRSYRMDSASKREVAERLEPALAKAAVVEVEPPPPPPATDTEAAPIAAPVKVEVPPPAPDEDAVVLAEESRYTRDSGADVEIGVSAVVRTLSFNSASALSPQQKPNGYKGSLVPSLVVGGEVYPFAFGGKTGGVSGLGLAFALDKVLVIKSKLSSSSTEYPTSQMRWGAGLRWRFNFGAKATGPSLKVGAGFGKLDFSIDHGTDDIKLPDVSYSYVDVGAGGRVPLGTARVALYLDLRYLQVLDAGQIANKDQYGGGTVRGFTGDAGVELIFARRGIVRAGARYQRMAFSFDGTGTMSTTLDGDPSNQDVGGALDEYWSGYLTGGYLF